MKDTRSIGYAIIMGLMMFSLSICSPFITTSIQAYHNTTIHSVDFPEVEFNDVLPQAITVSDTNPFYSIMATPLAVHYNPNGIQHCVPLYVLNFTNPSDAVLRAEQEIGIASNLLVSDLFSPKETSCWLAETFWMHSSAALIIHDSQEGYNQGIVATPLASYLGIPILITDTIDAEVIDSLETLSVDTLYLCHGNSMFDLSLMSNITTYNLTDISESIDLIKTIHSTLFHVPISYIALANPLDIQKPTIVDTTVLPVGGEIGSTTFLPTQMSALLFNDAGGDHTFSIPTHYKYARICIELENLHPEHVDELGDEVIFLLKNPEGHTIFYDGTMGGISNRDVLGNVERDRIVFETIIYDQPGEYSLQVYGKWFGRKTGSYLGTIRIEQLDTTLVPLMNQLSSLAPYLAAGRKGIVYAKPSFGFAADDSILFNEQPCPGVSQPGSNPQLITPSNIHTMQIHDELNMLLADIAGIQPSNLEQLRTYYKNNPINIAITADPTMVPMYFYKNPDGEADNTAAYMMGFALPSDFIYADIDPDPLDLENNTYSYWPYQENCVGRVTGRDVQDASALIARTFFYDELLDQYVQWKHRALVSTGCGLEFQNLPFVTRFSQFIYGGRGEPTKFPTGESTFINLRMQEVMNDGFSEVKGTFLLKSQRVGFSEDDLELIKNAGVLNKLLFPNHFIERISSDTEVTGGLDQMNSNLIFTFAHGSFSLFEHGDVLLDARGFPFITTLTRIYPVIRSGLNAKGSFDVRSVTDMTYGPSVLFVVSCITGRTDGLKADNTLSQAFLHAGVNAYIGATRVTADPGYLDPRPLPGGWGFGTLGLMKATLNLLIRGSYPDFHFGAVIGEDFINGLIDDDATVGLALRNAKNMYLPKDANSTFYWTPPLMHTVGSELLETKDTTINDSTPINLFEPTRALSKKYVAVHEFTLYGDPAFNPYQTENNG